MKTPLLDSVFHKTLLKRNTGKTNLTSDEDVNQHQKRQ